MPKYDAVVADAGPLISLEKLPGGFDLLRYTCSRLLVPLPVLGEVSHLLLPGEDYFARYRLPKAVTLEIVPEESIPAPEELATQRLGPGERSAISLAAARRVPLLAEERQARRQARNQGLRVFGAAAIIKIACEEEGISRQRAIELLEELFRAHRINQKVLRHLLRALPG
jgi:predicted nucleic acid-binding protein